MRALIRVVNTVLATTTFAAVSPSLMGPAQHVATAGRFSLNAPIVLREAPVAALTPRFAPTVRAHVAPLVATPKSRVPQVHPVARRVAVASPPRDELSFDGGRIVIPVVVYNDCTARTPLTRSAAAIDTCVSDRLYFVGHNPGVFTPLRSLSAGAVITYWNSVGQPLQLRISAVRAHDAAAGIAPGTTPGVIAEFQTCANSAGTEDWLYDAVAA